MPPEAQRATAPLTEAALLEREAAQARAALQGAIHDLQHSLRSAADVRYWTKGHPLAGVGLAAVAGFAAAALVKEVTTAVSSEAGEPQPAAPAPLSSGQASLPPAAAHAGLHSLLTPLWGLAKGLVETAVINAVKGTVSGAAHADAAAECAAAACPPADSDFAADESSLPSDRPSAL